MTRADVEAEVDILRQLEGGPIFTGLFQTHQEQAAVERLLERGAIERDYGHAAGFLGLSKIRLPRR